MRFEVTSDDHIQSMTDDLETDAYKQGSTFATEQEFQELAGGWPMKRLVEIWNRLPAVPPLQKFENRPIAIARIWRAIGGEGEPAGRAVPSPRRPGKRAAVRAGSKAAQVCSLVPGS